MKSSRFLACVLAALLSMTLLGMASAHARVPAGDPLATTVTGACAGGPGRLSLTVHPPAAGKLRVEVTARGLVEGSRWAIAVGQEGGERSRVKDFRRVAVDGRWTVMTQFPASADPEQGEEFFSGSAQERGDQGHRCFVLTTRAAAAGLSSCNSNRSIVALIARERDDGSTVVRSLIFSPRGDSRWHLALTATGEASRQVVEFDDRANRGGFVGSRVALTGVMDPRLRLVATNRDRGRCFIRFDPANETPDPSLKMPGLDRLIASRT